MKKMKAFVLMFLFFFLSTDVYAVCDAEESNTLNSLATNLGISYEIVEVEIPMDENFNPPDGITEEEYLDYVATRTYFRIYISNVTEELYVVVTNKSTNEKHTYTYEDAVNGIITFDEIVGISITNYTIDVYSSSATNCPNTLLYTHYLTTPLYNSYSEMSVCDGIEEFYLCHEYLSVDVDVNFDDFLKFVDEYKAGHIDDDGNEVVPPEDSEGGFLQFIGDHLVIVIISAVVIVAAGGLITFVVIKKQRSRIV